MEDVKKYWPILKVLRLDSYDFIPSIEILFADDIEDGFIIFLPAFARMDFFITRNIKDFKTFFHLHQF